MRKPLNLKDLGKTGKPAIPPTPFEQGLSGNSRPFSATPPTLTNPNPQDVFAPRSLPPTITKPTREDAFNPDAQAPAVDFTRTAVELPRINAKPWQIAAQNWRAKQAKEIGVGDITRDRNATVAETVSQVMIKRDALMKQLDPQTARIEAAKQALEALFAERPELAEQAKLSMPNEAQLGVAGLAALLQPGRAFESLAQPFQFQQQEQARQQQLNNQQFASDREEWGMMYQRAVGDLNSEYKMEETRLDNVGKSIQSFDDLVADLNSQEQQNFRAQLSANSKYTLQQLKGAQDFARAEMQQVAATQRELMKSPEQVAARIQARLIEGGIDPQTAFQIAWAEVQSDYFKNQKVQQDIEQAAQLFPLEMRQAVMNLAKTQEDIRAIAARADYTTAQTALMGQEFALRQLEHALNVEKFNQGLSQNAKNYDLLVAEKFFSSQRAYATLLEEQLKNANAQVNATAPGTPEHNAALARAQQLEIQLAKTRQDILSAQKAIETLGKKPLQNPGGQVNLTFGTVPGGAANSGGGFRSEPQWPVTGGRISSGYGPRRAPVRGASTDHKGIDIAVPAGTPIRPVWAGQVIRKGYEARGGGHYLVIRHPNGYETKYLHMQSASPLKIGDQVGNGTIIGKVGSTGNSTGPHLDVRILRNGEYVDPLTVLPRRR